MQRRFNALLQTAMVLFSAASIQAQTAALNACDLNADGAVNTADVNMAINMSTGAVTPCTANIIGNGVCNVVMVQRVINAAQGGTCGRTVTLTWTASISSGVVGYKVYRSTVNGGSYTALSATPVAGTSYVDSTVQSGLTYYYVVTSVNGSGSESGYSNQAAASVPNP